MAKVARCGLIVAGLVGACTPASAPPISTPAARLPTPSSVSHHDPAGDAEAPNDAALARLLDGKASIKSDKFLTLNALLPDRRNWRRIRVWTQPMRAVFRYGRKPYAVAFVSYSQHTDDSPFVCLERFAERAQITAERYGIELAPFERTLGKHWRGVESVDWQRVKRQRTSSRQLPRAARLTPKAKQPSSKNPRTARRRTRRFRQAGAAAFRRQRRRPQHGYGPMPIVRLRGQFNGIFGNDRYRGALVAHRSWPGSCLVYGFGVREGSDAALAESVVLRWLNAWAPRLAWRRHLRKAPAIKNR